MMKHTWKKTISMLLCLAMLLALGACGSSGSGAPALEADQVEADVQEYLTSFVDESAAVKTVYQSQESISDTETEVSCQVAYTTGSGDCTGTFTLLYEYADSQWTLSNCTAELDDAEQGQSGTMSEAAPEADTAPGEQGDAPAAGDTASAGQTAAFPEIEDSKIIVGYTLEQVGTFADQEDMGEDGIMGVALDQEGERAQFLTAAGTPFEGEYYALEDLGRGYYAFANSSTEVNAVGLYTIGGEQLIPCEAAIIDWMELNNGVDTGRYLKVIYGTGETTNEDACFFEVSDLMHLRGDEDAMYTGYAKVYDLQQRRFVGDLQFTNPESWCLCECGDAFTYEDSEEITYLYDADGNLLKQAGYCSDVGNGYMIVSDEGAYEVYDDTGAFCFSSTSVLSAVDSTSGFLRKHTDEGSVLVDINGNQVLPGAYKTFYGETCGIVRVELPSGGHQLMNLDGEVLAASDDYFSEIAPGYYYTETESGTYILVGPDGILAEGLASAPGGACVLDGTTGLVLNDGTFSLAVESDRFTVLDTGLISVKSESTGKYGVYELFTGTQLLDCQYAEVQAIPGYLYVRQESTWTAYRLVCQYK